MHMLIVIRGPMKQINELAIAKTKMVVNRPIILNI